MSFSWLMMFSMFPNHRNFALDANFSTKTSWGEMGWKPAGGYFIGGECGQGGEIWTPPFSPGFSSLLNIETLTIRDVHDPGWLQKSFWNDESISLLKVVWFSLYRKLPTEIGKFHMAENSTCFHLDSWQVFGMLSFTSALASFARSRKMVEKSRRVKTPGSWVLEKWC